MEGRRRARTIGGVELHSRRVEEVWSCTTDALKNTSPKNRGNYQKGLSERVPITMSNTEQTYIMMKPDGVQRGIVGGIIARFEGRGYKLVALKLAKPSRSHLELHYADLAKKKFFPSLIEYMLSGPVVCMVWEGLDAVKTSRMMLGATNPLDSLPGTIRGDLCTDVGRNICHGSDAVESANHEIGLWFPDGVCDWDLGMAGWLYENLPASTEASAEAKSKKKPCLWPLLAYLHRGMHSLVDSALTCKGVLNELICLRSSAQPFACVARCSHVVFHLRQPL